MAWAMVSASTGAMNSVLSKLTNLLGDEYRLPKGPRRDIVVLRDELTSMKGLMEKLAATEDLDPLVRGWMKQVREMTYDLEDYIDVFVHSAGQGDARKGISRLIQRLKRLRSLHQIANQMKELQNRIREASERRARYKLDDAVTRYKPDDAVTNSSYRTEPIDPRLPELYAKPDSLVGIDGPMEKLIQWLAADGQQQLKVVSIVGLGGTGKTTLAMEVYRRLQAKFDCWAFVSVSQNPDIKKILRNILSQVSVDEYDSREAFHDADELINAIRELLKHKRYFVIIDDIWDVTTWNIIRFALPQNNCDSRILVTTRITSVARSCCYSEDHIFQMKPLSLDEARNLFFRRIFHSEYRCPPHLEQISEVILKKSGGLPLAIITIASLLAAKSDTEQEWARVRDSFSSALDKDFCLEELRRTLNLSYFDLPFHLRTCLLYLSIFPEDYVIDRAQLIRRWMAEGFIIEGREKSLEQVGEGYFDELINRSLIQPVDIRYGRIHACSVHDLILDLIMSKSVEENFVTIYGNYDHIYGPQNKVHRLSLYRRDREGTFIPSAITTSHVRSLIIFGANKQMPVLENFQALRVLDMECSGELENGFLRDIGRLYLLKYLRLQTTSTIALPEQIGKLQYLETLDLAGAHKSKLPSSIVRLKQLIHLLVNNVKLPDGIGALQALQELSHVEVDRTNSASSLQELGSLTALRVLGLNWCISDTNTEKKSYADNLVLSLDNLSRSNLQSLFVESSDGCSLDFLLDSWSIPSYRLKEFRMKSKYYYFPRIPEWMPSLINLTFLEINIDPVEDKVLHILGELPGLLVMILSSESTPPEQRLIIRSYGFQHLQEFGFTCWNSWPVLMFEPGAMPQLKKHQLVFSAQGECVPNGFHFGIEHLASLKHLVVEINCRGARSSVVEAAEYTIKSAVELHPNDPRLELRRLDEQHTVKNEREISVHGDEEDKEGKNNEGGDDVEREVVVVESTPTTEN